MTPADRVYAQAADYIGTNPDARDRLARDWRNARRSHRRLRPGLTTGLLAAARAQTTNDTGSAA